MSKHYHGYWERETSDPGDKRPPAPSPRVIAVRDVRLHDEDVLARVKHERDEALVQRDRARALACRLEEELALIRRAAAERRTRV